MQSRLQAIDAETGQVLFTITDYKSPVESLGEPLDGYGGSPTDVMLVDGRVWVAN